jgi:hypothetical protein
MKQYYDYSDFYYSFEEEHKRHLTIEDIDVLIARLKNDGYKVRALSDGRVIVRSPEEIKVSDARRKAKQAIGAALFTKLGAAFPREVATTFAEACRQLGCTQSEILMPIVNNTIERAKLMREDRQMIDGILA